MRRHQRTFGGAAAKVALVLGILGVLWATWFLLDQVGQEETDFSVFWRTARALEGGVEPRFYDTLDKTGWLHCIPPAGTTLLAWTHFFSPLAAAAVWAGLNVGLLAACSLALLSIYRRLDRQSRLYQSTWLWAVGLLLFLSAGSLQVGQLSILFTTLWLLYLLADARSQHFLAAVSLALPTVIKLYPGLLLAVPCFLSRRRQLLLLLPATVVVAVLLPALVYGRNLPNMYYGFVRYALLGSNSRLADTANINVRSNQSVDVTLHRYLTHTEPFHSVHPHFPHLRLPQEVVSALAHVFRAVVLLVATVASWRWQRRAPPCPRWSAVLLMGLWTATLYLILPETKARYAVYIYPAFLPLLAMAAAARVRDGRWRYGTICVVIFLCAASILQVFPYGMRVYGSSLVANAAVWAANLRALSRRSAGDGARAPAVDSAEVIGANAGQSDVGRSSHSGTSST